MHPNECHGPKGFLRRCPGKTKKACRFVAIGPKTLRMFQLLCRYGADTEDVFRLMTGMPGLPITIAATYHHLKCFAALLVYGAEPGLTQDLIEKLPTYVTTQCSVPHAIIKYRCPPEFVYLYWEFGGNLWFRDSRQRLATEISDRAPALELMKVLQGTFLHGFVQ